MKRNEKIQKLISSEKAYSAFYDDENLKELYNDSDFDFDKDLVEYSFNRTGFSVLIRAFKNNDKQFLNVKEIKKDFKWHECNAAWIDYLSGECIKLKGPGFSWETMAYKIDIKSSKSYYDLTQNPMFLWHIYSICRKAKFKIPEYVYEYFDRGAFNLNELRKDKSKGKPGDKIADALEMRVKDSTYHNVYHYKDLAIKHSLIHSIVKNLKRDHKELSDFEKLKIDESVFDLAQKKLKKDFGYSVSTKRIDDVYYDQKILIKEENKREKEKREERISALQKKK